MADWVDIGLGFGGNLGDPEAAIGSALRVLAERGRVRVKRCSALYRTSPWGPVPQPDFANACALATTDLAPHALLAELKAVEVSLGRRAGARWGPRLIDIDLLFYGDVIVTTSELVIPHPGLFERAFVLIPLAAIAPDLVIAGRRVNEAARRVGCDGVSPWTGVASFPDNEL